MSRMTSRQTLCSIVTLIALTEIACSPSRRDYPDDDAGVGGKTATGGTHTAPGKTATAGVSNTGGKANTGGATENVGGDTGTGGTSAIQTSGIVGAQTGGGSGLTQTLGGTSSMGGSQAPGGTSAVGGSQGGGVNTGSGGKSNSGGASTGGTSTLGGTTANGGATSTSTSVVTGGQTGAGGTFTGGKAGTGGTVVAGGGATPTGGSNAATGGKSATGGAPPTGGAATGGAATGGAATGGATTGGAPTGGTTALANAFVGGPCAATPDASNVEVFARGSDQHIHRRVVSSTSTGTWGTVSSLDGSLIDVRSDLDCSANSTTVHIAATGSSPLGAVLHASGFGTNYNPFARELTSSTYNASPSVAHWGSTNAFVLGALTGTALDVESIANGTPTSITPLLPNASLASPPDLAYQDIPLQNTLFLAVLDNSGKVEVNFYGSGTTSSRWNGSPVSIPPPSGTVYSLAPTICAQSSGGLAKHLFAVANGKLWYLPISDLANAPTTAWESVTTPALASSPDCTATSDGDAHVVFLGEAGNVLEIHGHSSSWTVSDLGGY